MKKVKLSWKPQMVLDGLYLCDGVRTVAVIKPCGDGWIWSAPSGGGWAGNTLPISSLKEAKKRASDYVKRVGIVKC